MHTNNRTRPSGRAVPYLAIAIYRQGFIAAFGQLKGGSCANNTGSNNNRIHAIAHLCLSFSDSRIFHLIA